MRKEEGTKERKEIWLKWGKMSHLYLVSLTNYIWSLKENYNITWYTGQCLLIEEKVNGPNQNWGFPHFHSGGKILLPLYCM